MKNLLPFVLLLLITPTTYAQKIWIQAQPHLAIPSDGISYSNFKKNRHLQLASVLNSKLINWGQETLINENKNLKDFVAELDNNLSEKMSNESERSFVLDLINKIDTKTKNQNLKTMQCTLMSLDAKESENDCQFEKITFEQIRMKFPFINLILIEDVEIYPNDFKKINRSGKYHWTLLSNTHQEINFWGTIDELFAQNIYPQFLVSGTCSNFKSSIQDIELESKAWIAFEGNCQQPLAQPEKMGLTKWYGENKSWVVPVGISAAVLIGYYLKDKKIVIKSF